MEYPKLTKDELLAEVAKRGTEGRKLEVSAADKKEDIVSALELDDEAKENEAASNAASGIPNVEKKEPVLPSESLVPTEYKGIYVNSENGEPYGLAVVENEPSGKTHFCKNSVHFWQGTKEEFKAQFDKK
jgi:hypothetical protein